MASDLSIDSAGVIIDGTVSGSCDCSLAGSPSAGTLVKSRYRDERAAAREADLAPLRSLSRTESKHPAIFKRMARNIAWLLGGRGFAAVVSLGYLALTVRALGPHGFGTFTLVLTFGQMIAQFVQFQSWKTVLRYGASCLEAGDHDRLARLLGLTATLDWLAAISGAAIAAIAA